ncbi:hypothetical protein Riv7116_4720 [Rivularia sp. PCC 7116]|uniref:hypothetical protein n=1 Tax=Rivularia sp. PCC 7116 TaxID=373994 RepID=UPI00029F13B2|nr:hypothetical protein [Rivularia sp. PCC 7116]AFY57134.1 hypothetical protein Riv7116_4720 [Rivularia sp. PCC 7116]
MKIWATTFFLAFVGLISPVKAAEVMIAYDSANTAIKSKATTLRKPIIVKKAEFGVLRTDKNGKVTFIPTTKVPYQEGKVYGWRIQLQGYEGKLTWQEVLTLPKPPLTWGTDNGQHFFLSPDGTKSVIKRTDSIKKGIVNNFWTVSSGDPEGLHVIEVYAGKRRIAKFKFEVVKPPF